MHRDQHSGEKTTNNKYRKTKEYTSITNSNCFSLIENPIFLVCTLFPTITIRII